MTVTKRDEQEEWMPYPGGRIFFTVLRLVPGDNVGKIRDELSRQQRKSIRSQLVKILEAMADKNRILRTVNLNFLRYDRENDKL